MKRQTLLAVFVSLFLGSSLIGETNTAELTSGYNSPARIDVQGSWDIFFTGSYIYWQPREDGLELGVLHATLPAEEHVYTMDFDYKSGFKVGLGASFCSDNWVAYLDYTRLHTADHTNIAADDSIWLLLIADTTLAASASWKLRYDMLDLVLARPFYSGTCFILDGFFGLKGGWINQKFAMDCLSGSDQAFHYGDTQIYNNSKTNSWLIGPQAGVNLKYLLGAGFRLFGDASASLLYQKLKTSVKSTVGLFETLFAFLPTNVKESYNQITPNFNFASGLGWGTYFDKNNWNFDLSAAYEFQYYLGQNRMKRAFDFATGNWTSQKVTGKAKDLVLHGLTITARLDF